MDRGGAITDVPGLLVGHATDPDALTGCTVVLCPDGAVAAVDVRGAAPGTRETDLLRPENLVEHVHAVLLTGGSAFGLDAAAGVVRWLEERGHGFPAGPVRVPIVPAAVLFDLAVGRADARPDAEMGYRACEAAAVGPVAQGNAGTGTGATVGKALGLAQATKAGIGTCSVRLGGPVNGTDWPMGGTVGAIVAVNAFGDVVDPGSGRIVAGARDPESGPGFVDSSRWTIEGRGAGAFAAQPQPGTNTTIGVVATDVPLTKAQALKVAQMAHAGIARAVRPSHTLFDGDTLFVLSLPTAAGVGAWATDPARVNAVGVAAAEAVAGAILNAVRFAKAAAGLPATADLGSLE